MAQSKVVSAPRQSIVRKLWEMEVPNDWVDKGSDQYKTHMMSGDGSKGFYCATWKLESLVKDSSEASAIQKMKSAGEVGRKGAKGYHWEKLSETRSTASGVTRYEEDYLDHYHRCRTKTLVLISHGFVLRADFQDYAFSTLKVSNAVFDPLITSCRLR